MLAEGLPTEAAEMRLRIQSLDSSCTAV